MDLMMTNLYASAPEPLPFGDSLVIRAYVLRRDQGNLLVYSNGTIESDAQEIEQLGGVARHGGKCLRLHRPGRHPATHRRDPGPGARWR
jgi:hypothetical protein